MFGEFDNVFSCGLGSSKSADELYEKHVSDGTINDVIKTCRKCGRELSDDEFIWCSDCDKDD